MLVDSNILIYSINTASPKCKRAQHFIKKNTGNLEIAHQNILETMRVLTHPKSPSPMDIKHASDAIEAILKVCKIISPDYRTSHLTLELIKKYKLTSNRIFDAYLVATALSNGISIIATDNTKDFQKFKELTIINPFL